MPSVFKATVPSYMIDLELCSACGGQLQLGVVLVLSVLISTRAANSFYTVYNYLLGTVRISFTHIKYISSIHLNYII